MVRAQAELRGTSSQADETLEGVLEKLVFVNPDNAWSVLKLEIPGRRGAVTVVGNIVGVQPGESLRLTGRWEEDRKWGKRFRASSFHTVRPATTEGIERYLSSGLIRGIGKKMAERLVEAFGLGTLEIIESHPERLRQVEGIGPKRSRQILEAWEEQRHIQRVMVFLQSHGISTGHAVRIFKTYGAEAEQLVTENPYRLAEDIFGIGFKSADQIAEHLGIARDSPRRIEAGILHTLRQASDAGHVYLPQGQLVTAATALLEVPPPLVETGIADLVDRRQLISDEVEDSAEPALYTPPLHAAEVALATRLKRLLAAPSRLPAVDSERAIEWFEAREKIELAPQQRQAIAQALDLPVLVITGGPGTGKTTLLRGIVEILQRKEARILLAAPTGRAARRLAEATGRDARTVHRLLEFDPRSRTFARGLDLPLDGELIIVDEASMLDLALARSTVAAVPLGARLIFVGDVDQLPSVGPGRVLADLITSSAVPVVRLTEIFRQAAESRIVVNAHRINRGEAPILDGGETSPRSDFFFFERDDPQEVEDTIIHLLTERIPRGFHLDPLRDIQVLSPMNRGQLGVFHLNHRLQSILNPDGKPIGRGPRELRLGDKVMQLRNNYDLDVFNGDVGRVVAVDEVEQVVKVGFDDRLVLYGVADLDELVPAYACSIHKSQGSEYPCVVVPLHTQHFRMLQRNLLYTALTRAKKLAVLVGQRRALQLAVRNQDTRRRYTRLAHRLAGGGSHPGGNHHDDPRMP